MLSNMKPLPLHRGGKALERGVSQKTCLWKWILQPAANRVLVKRYLLPGKGVVCCKIETFYQPFNQKSMKKFYFFCAAFMLGSGLLNAQVALNTDDVVSDFENLVLEPGSYWNGSDLSGHFVSGLGLFPNDYDPEWMAWNRWAYSNMADDTTAGWGNQYSAITAGGYDPEGSGGSNFALAYLKTDYATGQLENIALKFTDSIPHLVRGFYVTNATYPALSMQHGDDYSKKFGGATGDDPDYFRLMVWGMSGGVSTDTVEHYLADYRFADNGLDYILRSWEWVGLEGLGEVDSLMFSLESTDVGMFGMNTPSFFCVVNLTVVPDDTGIDDRWDEIAVQIYPNPSGGLFRVETGRGGMAAIRVADMYGNIVYLDEHFVTGAMLDLSALAPGSYLLMLQEGTRMGSRRLLIR